MTVKYGILAPLVAQIGKDADVAEFLDAGYSIVQSEPDTIQWFAVKYNDVTPSTFAIFDTFTSEAGRQAHLDGQVPVALSANAARLLAPEPVDIGQVEVLASKVEKVASTKTAGLSLGLRVLIEAKPEKVQTVRDFLISALPLVDEEPETPVWYAIYIPGTNKFGIIDFFASEAGRNAHLGGKVAAALFSSVDELLTGAPDVVKVDVLAAKISG
ncbi:hypothetical protein BYT27DRAFT_7188294 [Phlegmacium glaucopus]|nr:hypothetical protein BYT27DRAFT_7188294 [Phlegmacium glaucopus]